MVRPRKRHYIASTKWRVVLRRPRSQPGIGTIRHSRSQRRKPFRRKSIRCCASRVVLTKCTGDYGANDYTSSTTHPEIHAIRLRLVEKQSESFADSLASCLEGLCRRCLRLFNQRRIQQPQRRVPSEYAEMTR
jgi:hypothetical protein